jgi:hypothetical protein
MSLTVDEKRTARAYNIGYLMSVYEPQLLENIIKRNPNNEFIKAMQLGRDYNEFHTNVPRKDYNREFKNGFYNGRALVENSPEIIERLITTKGLNKDYKKGLESAKKEFTIQSIYKKMNEQPKAPKEDLRNDANFKKGFNVGYLLADEYGSTLNHAKSMNEKYSKFIDGVTAGKEQYNFDLAEIQEKDPKGRVFSEDAKRTTYESATIESKVGELGDISSDQLRAIERQKGFENAPAPKWLQKKSQEKESKTPQKQKGKDIDHDR